MPKDSNFFNGNIPTNQPVNTSTSLYNECILDNTAQLRKVIPDPERLKKEILVKKAKNKFVTQFIALALSRVPFTPLRNGYINTLSCGNELTQDGQKIVSSKYCNNRWCNVCNRIRTSKLIEAYKKPLAALVDPYFVTLTIVNVPAEDLEASIKDMAKTFQEIKDMFRKRKTPITGIRKLECTYNSEDNEYHPHYHFIVEGEQVAKELRLEWMRRYPNVWNIAQDVQPATEGSILELFKYFTKMITKKFKDGKEVPGERKIYIKAMDIIFCSMAGKRVFQPMGIKKYVSEDIDEITSQEYEIEPDNYIWVWEQSSADWIARKLHVNYETWTNYEIKHRLTGFVPSAGIMALINSIDSS